MSRLLWVGVGAAGGIYTYRRGQRAWEQAKERGVGGTATVLAAAATSALHTVRTAVLEDQGPSAGNEQAGARSYEPGAAVRGRGPAARRGADRRPGWGSAAVRVATRTARSSARPRAATLG